MLKNYFKITLRRMLRNKTFSFTNVFGLTIGIVTTIFILLWVMDELSFDRFYKNADNIYLVLRDENSGMSAMTSKFLAPAIKQELPEVKNATSYSQLPSSIKVLIQNDSKGFEENFALADSNFFNIFSLRFLEGNASTALIEPNSIVITKRMAEKYFGNENAIGKMLNVGLFGKKQIMNVRGVIANIPTNSNLQSEVIFPKDLFQTFGSKENGWKDQTFETYILLSSKVKDISLVEKLSSQIKQCELMHNEVKDNKLQYSLMPVGDIHLYGSEIKFLNENGNIKYVRIFSVVAIFILLIACVNYMNLSTALSLKRTKEIGIKKTIGAERKLLIIQFVSEGFVYSFAALVLAILLIELLLPGFNRLTNKNISIDFFSLQFIGIIASIAVVTGLLSSIYPALFLSSFQPIQILSGKLKFTDSGLLTRKGLVIFQFGISIIMIVSTLIVYNQLNFIRTKNLGIDRENLLCISMSGDSNKKYEVIRNEVLANPGIVSVTRSEEVNSNTLSATGAVYRNDKGKYVECPSWVLYSDSHFASTYKIQMKEGRYFSDAFPTDAKNAFVVNEVAAKAMNLESPLNEMIYLRGRLGKIIGVARDFHFSSFRNSIEPLVFMIPDSSQQAGRYRIITLRYKSGEPEKIISFVEKIWKEELPGTPFKYHFFDDSINALYNSEIRMGVLFTTFSFLSILIVCVGLFGLVSISVEQSAKEIGIRKVLGASIRNILLLVSKQFITWVLIANVIAAPVAYYFMNKWLQGFAYRIEITWWEFALSSGIAFVIVLATISIQAIKAAVANPVESLRYE